MPFLVAVAEDWDVLSGVNEGVVILLSAERQCGR